MGLTQVSTNGVKDGSLLNADINASAAIAGTKIDPNFKSTGSNIDEISLTHSGNTVKIASLGQISSHGSLALRTNSGALSVRLSATTESSYINSGANFGIGTTSPDDLLEVSSSTADKRLLLTKASSGTANESGMTLHFQNFGPAATGRNDGTLIGRVRFSASQPTSGGLQDAGAIECRADGTQTGNNTRSRLSFLTVDSQTATERMRIDKDGNVGIGTSSPSSVLHLLNSNNTVLTIGNSSYDDGVIQYYNGSLLLKTGASNGDRTMSFATAGSERMRIRSNGNVMIGNSAHFTANVAKLDVVHAGNNTAPTYVSRFFQETNDLGSDHACIQLRHGAASGTQDATMIDFKNSGGHTHGSIKMDGSSVSFNSTSDYRIKENLVSLSNAITRLKTLKAYRFNFKDNPTKTVDGFLAHEVTAVPEAITGTKDEVDSNNNPVYQGIDQSKLVPLLVAAVQELITKVETLEAA